MPASYASRVKALAGAPEARSATGAFLATAISMAGGFLFWMAAAWMYTTIEVGTAATAVAGAGLVAIFAKLGLDSHLPRLVSASGATPDAARHIFRALGWASLLAALGGVVLGAFLVISGIAGGAGWDWRFAVVLAVTCVGMAVLAVTDPLFISLGRVRALIVRSFVLAFARLALVPLLVGEEDGLLLAWVASVVLTAVPSVVLLFRALRKHPEVLPSVAWSWSFLGANYVASVLSAVPALGLPVLIAQFREPSAVAFYYIAWNISSLIQSIPQSMTAWLLTQGHTAEQLRHASRRFLLASTALVIPALALVVITGPWLLAIIGDDYATQATLPLLILCAATVPGIWLALASTELRMQSRRGDLLGVHVVLAAVTLGVAALLVPIWSIAGASAGWFVATTVAVLFANWLRRRRHGQRGR